MSDDYYVHEIPCPDNKAIRKYLWFDYFHDSTITNIAFERKYGTVALTVECIRDMDEIWHTLKGADDARRANINENMDRFTYILSFKGTEYFHAERIPSANDYLGGCFKDTALLRDLAAESKKPLYHFRIQVDDGYMDVIFSDFFIRKRTGRVNYTVKGFIDHTYEEFDESARKTALEGDDYNRFLSMHMLFRANEPDLREIARKNLLFDEGGEACLYAAYLLGKLGDANDIPQLLDLYLRIEELYMAAGICRCSALLPKRNILDAIELIRRRGSMDPGDCG